jgi:hypothetical protein
MQLKQTRLCMWVVCTRGRVCDLYMYEYVYRYVYILAYYHMRLYMYIYISYILAYMCVYVYFTCVRRMCKCTIQINTLSQYFKMKQNEK